eukprot:gene23201-30075_t
MTLQSEIRGTLPPPNSPPGAYSPFQPRQRVGMLVYSANINTEVLSSGTRSATIQDLSHSRDDGIFKQGYLFISKTLTIQRKWHRLYESKLYVIENSSTSTTSTNKGKRLEFQADNEDEMISWIYALRRCAVGAKRRDNDLIDNNINVREGPNSDLLLQYIYKNCECGECNDQPVRWVSINLGVTLCENCSIGHRHLTWSVSKLKNLEYDLFLGYQVDLLLNELGNDFNALIWEASIPQGWSKPNPNATQEEKAKAL